MSGHPVHVSQRYQRQGALHFFGALSVVDDLVCGICCQRKRFVDFQALLLDQVIHEAMRRRVHTVALILDNGTAHASKQLERWLQAQCVLYGGLLSFQVFWLPTPITSLLTLIFDGLYLAHRTLISYHM